MIQRHLTEILLRESRGKLPDGAEPLIAEVAGGLLTGIHMGLFYNVDVLECETWLDVVLLYHDGMERIHDRLSPQLQEAIGPPPTLTELLAS